MVASYLCGCFGVKGKAEEEVSAAPVQHQPAPPKGAAQAKPTTVDNELVSAVNAKSDVTKDTGRSAAQGPGLALTPGLGTVQHTPPSDLRGGVLQGLELQRKISQLAGHWWNRVEDAVDVLARAYGAACASVWLMDEQTESFVVLISKGPMQQAVQPGYTLHLGSEYDANCPSSLSSLWDTKGPQSYSVNRHSHCHSSNSSSLHGRRFPADWKLLYNAHHFTDFLAWPLMAPSAQRANAGSAAAGVNLDSLCSGNVLYNSGHTVGPGSALAAACASQEGGSFVVGAITLYLSRPGADLVGDAPPSVFSNTLEQELVGLALSGVLFSGGFEPVRQICELVMALQTSTGTGELAAAVAACLQARLRHVLSVQPTALLALVPPRQVSALVFRDLSAAPTDAAGGDMTSTVGQSSSQTLPLLHPALASATGAGTGGGANSNLYSGSHSHGGGAARVALRNAAVAAAGLDGSSPAHTIERSPSLLGTGLRHAAGAGGDTNGAGASASGQVGGTGASVGEGIVVGGGGTGPGGGSRLHMQNSRSMGVLQQNNPSGLFSCRLDRMPSRYKALVFPLSHTLLQQVLLQRQDRGKGSKGGSQEADPKRPGAVGLRDMCMSAAAAAAAAGGASSGGWIIADCNEHLHAVHSPSRDVYVMTRVNGRRPHSLVLATAELGGGLEPVGGVGGMSAAAAGAAGSACIAVYLAFPERLPQALLESALNDTMLIMRKLVSPLVRLRFDGNLAEEWSALAAGANNLPSPGGPVLRIAGASVSASQMRQAPQVPPSMLLSGANTNEGVGSPGGPNMESLSTMWLSKLGGSGHYAGSPVGVAGALAQANATVASVGTVGMNSTPMGASLLPGGGSSVGVGAPMSTSELHLEGLSAGEALQQMSVLVSSYMDTLQALQGQLMGNDRVAEALRREDLPHLQLLEVLGHGGGGVVFRGKLHALEVAIKVFEVPGDLATAAGLASLSDKVGGAGGKGDSDKAAAAWPAIGDRRVLQRSALELAVTASVSHPHIVQVYSLYTNMVLVKQKPPKHGTSGVQLLELSAATAMSRMEEGIPCSALCIEYCDMGTLAHAIDQNRFMTITPLGARRPALKAICTTLLEVALALRHLHARNLAHCDLKPANVLLKSSRRDSRGFTCKLADFGYVSVLKPTVPGGRPTILPEEACGTVTHMAPETFIKGQPLDASVDTYSFGVLMWELFTCSRPYADVPEDQIAQRVTLKGLRPVFPPDTPRAYSALARQCWSQDPNERPSASEIVSAIESMLQIMSTQLPAIPPLKPKPAAPAGAGAAAPAAAAPAGQAPAKVPAAAGAGAAIAAAKDPAAK